jgi:hypothetical protein
MPKGDEEEIAGREGFFRFVALLAPRALLERPTLNPSLFRDQLGLMASVRSIRLAQMLDLCLGQGAYANLVGDARLQSNSRPVASRPGAEASRSPPSPTNRSRSSGSVRLRFAFSVGRRNWQFKWLLWQRSWPP